MKAMYKLLLVLGIFFAGAGGIACWGLTEALVAAFLHADGPRPDRFQL